MQTSLQQDTLRLCSLLLESHARNTTEYGFTQAMSNYEWLTINATAAWLTEAEFKSDLKRKTNKQTLHKFFYNEEKFNIDQKEKLTSLAVTLILFYFFFNK